MTAVASLEGFLLLAAGSRLELHALEVAEAGCQCCFLLVVRASCSKVALQLTAGSRLDVCAVKVAA